MLLTSLDRKSLRVEVVSGEHAILTLLPSLQPIFESWGQFSEYAELPFLLSVPVAPRRRPLLVLLLRAGSGERYASQPVGAVLLFAYSAALFGNRLLAHPDRSGRRCVFGPATERTSIAAVATRALLERGAALLTLPYRTADDPASATLNTPGMPVSAEQDTSAPEKQRALAALGMMGTGADIQWILQSAGRRLDLQLEPELDLTLQRIGKRTRRNLRAATRRCVRDMGARFHWQPSLTAADLAPINAQSTHPVRGEVLRWRHTVSQQVPGAFLAGLRTSTGEWMALAGGRRIGDAVTLDWQMNPKHFARFSVSLVMRGFLFAHLGAEGVTRMRFEGGTTHTLSRGFRSGTVHTLRVRKQSLWLNSLERVLTTFFPSRAITLNLFPRQGKEGNIDLNLPQPGSEASA